jgi:thiol:disulfide interchange protein
MIYIFNIHLMNTEGKSLNLKATLMTIAAFFYKNDSFIPGSRSLLTAAMLCIAAIPLAIAQEPVPSIEATQAYSKQAYAPGDTAIIALRITIPRGFHFFDNPMGPGIGKPMTYAVSGSQEISWLHLLKTKSKKYRPEIGEWVKGFEGEVVFFLRGAVDRNAPVGQYKGTLTIGGLICKEACHPVDKRVELAVSIEPKSAPGKHFEKEPALAHRLAKTRIVQALEQPVAAAMDSSAAALSAIALFPNSMPIRQESAGYAWNYMPLEAGSDLNLWLAILFGFIAGIILNAMPCVLPVLGVKILSFSQGAGLDRKKAVLHSLVFSAGVVSVFLLLAALASFANFSWGRQFQEPAALVAIITLIVIFSLGMFDIYLIAVPGSMGNAANKKQTGILGHLFSGIFATVLATPCSGPFLGAVLAWSVTQPAGIIFTVYGSIGLGMSFPYILLSASNRLARIVPKPGAWMNDFKKIMGFLLLGFALYLMLGLPADYVVPTVLFCVIVAFSVVIFGRIAPFGSGIARKIVATVVSTLVAALGLYLSFFIVYPSFSDSKATALEQKEQTWRDFNPDSLIAAHKQGRPAMVDFTANWCMNCQYNYIAVLTRKEIVDLIGQKNVLALKADMTSPNPVQDSLLHSLGSRSIPFLAIFPGDKPYKPIVMRDVLTVGKVMKALEVLH